MPRNENSLLAVFRRRSSSRDLSKGKTEEEVAPEKAVVDSPVVEVEGPVEESKQVEEDEVEQEEEQEDKDKEEDQSGTVDLKPRAVERAVGLCKEKIEEEEVKFGCICEANPVKETRTESDDVFGLEAASLGYATLTNQELKDPMVAPKNHKSGPWMKTTARLGWIPGRVKRLENNRFVVEPVVALTDAIEGMTLDESIVRAMAGKRGSFSSERSIRTESSDGSESKRARVWASVFRRTPH